MVIHGEHRPVLFDSSLVAGIDVGRLNDRTALAVLEVLRPKANLEGLHFTLVDDARAEAKAVPVQYRLRGLERLPNNMLFPEQADRIVARLTDPRLRSPRAFMDRGGMGIGLLDELKKRRLPNLQGVQITGALSDAKTNPLGWNVGKDELINKVLVLLQTDQLVFEQELPDINLLESELKEFKAQIRANGRTDYNAAPGQHDDLVLALALAVFGATRPRPVTHLDLRFAV